MLLSISPPAPARELTNIHDDSSEAWQPHEAPLSAYVFKIQANMDPKHRDSLAFVRICSGVLERDTVVKQIRQREIVRELRLSRPATLVAKERTTLDAAWPGDVVGLVNAVFHRRFDHRCKGLSAGRQRAQAAAGIRPGGICPGRFER